MKKKWLIYTIIFIVLLSFSAIILITFWPQAEIIKSLPIIHKTKTPEEVAVNTDSGNEESAPATEESSPATEEVNDNSSYPLHQQITSTIFWVGEGSSEDNDFITNTASAWDSFWQEHFGGVDNPASRNNYFPAEFTPKENPFYFALPYNDLNENGHRKENAEEIVYWGKDKAWAENESMLKNRWIKITKNGQTVYAQWEDCGPFEYNDSDYVFGSNNPSNGENDSAGIDLSPAVRDYLSLEDIDMVDWQFVNDEEVPSGPWKEIVSTSQISF
jgi:hypothetical protein